MPRDCVLITAARGDIHAEVVARRVIDLGYRCVILDSADFPSRCQITATYGDNGELQFQIRLEDLWLDESEILSVWWRRYNGHDIPPTDSTSHIDSDEVTEFCTQEARSMFRGLIASLGRRVINTPMATFYANHKVIQLMHAARCGLVVPQTLLTNSSIAVLDFVTSKDSIIFKPFNQPQSGIAETRRMDGNAIEQLDRLQFAPAIFQETIGRCFDIRSTVVGEHIFSAQISLSSEDGPLDWRLDDAVSLQPYDLDATTEDKLRLLVRALGLRYAAIDLIVDNSGRPVFLEVNPGGQFLFVEIHAGLDISQALGELLTVETSL